jgi:hypothetical protein
MIDMTTRRGGSTELSVVGATMAPMDDILCTDGREHELYENEAGVGYCLVCGYETEVAEPAPIRRSA